MTALSWEPFVGCGLVPDAALRAGIRRLCAARLRAERASDPAEAERRHGSFVARMRTSPIAIHPADANAQHYEVPPEFFRLVLGKRLKYSACLFESGTASLDEAEAAMLDLTCRRAGLADGQEILELGCGWGSLTLFMAERYPAARITAVSNSRDQRGFIKREALARGLANVSVLTADMNAFEAPGVYDRVVSVEMFEHMRNWELLLSRIARWMRPEARLFLHVFCHRTVAYPFEADEEPGASDWMARNFFTGGLMPSERLIREFTGDVVVEEQWRVSGTHYQRTAESWLANLDARRSEVLALFGRIHPPADARRRVRAWRLFFMACAELFGSSAGTEWLVSHALLRRR